MEDSCLDRVETKVSSDKFVKVTSFHSVVAKQTQLPGEFPAPADSDSAVAGSAEILCREKAEERGLAECSRPAGAAIARIFRSNGLGRVFDDRQAIGHDLRSQRIHRAARPEKMNGNHGANTVATPGNQSAVGAGLKALQAFSQFFRIHVKGVGSYVHKDRLGADSMNPARRRKERVGRRDDSVARTDLHRHEDGNLSIGAEDMPTA